MSRQGQVKRRVHNHKILFEYLNGKPCIDCGESDILKLSFDHVYGEKHSDISQMVANTGMNKVLNGFLDNEISKCVVRCANCHQKRTVLSQMSSKTIAYVEYYNL